MATPAARAKLRAVHIDLDRDVSAADARARLDGQGFVTLTPPALAALSGHAASELAALAPYWDHLVPDRYLRDGGHYRARRHGCAVLDVARDRLDDVPHRAHWQPVEYNALHGGIERWFEPVEAEVAASPAWQGMLVAMGRLASSLRGEQPWFLEAHQFRIDTTDGIGRPTPEGAHRDGVDFVAVVLVERSGIKGGETRVFAADGPTGMRFTMQAPWTCLLLDDARVIHESTPIQPLEAYGHRDTLVLTLRAGGFQGAV